MPSPIHQGLEVHSSTGAVAAGPPDAARAGAAILEQGGNAFDAAAAACLASAILEPQAVDLGGYVLAAVVREGASGRIWSLDANTVAPAAASPSMFRTQPVRPNAPYPDINVREYGCSVLDDANLYGPLAVSVPAFLAGVGTLSERWGRLPWPEIVAPARSLVAAGIPWSTLLSDILFKRDAILRFPSTAAYLLPSGLDHLPDPASLWLRPDLLNTLDRLAAAGWRDFYTGDLAHTIADFVTAQGGLLSREDMAAFHPRISAPLSSTYRGIPIHTAIAPNGGFSVLEALTALDRLPATPPSSPHYWETLAAALTSMWTSRLAGAPTPGTSPYGTMHIAAADRSGNVVSVTISQGGLFGACLAVPQTGVILAHGMCRFDPFPDHPNAPGPRKRPLNNVCPLLLQFPDRDLAIGVRGGRRIVSVSVELVQRLIDDHASILQAATAPRLHTLTGNPLEISADFDPALRSALQAAGHTLTVPSEVAGSAHGASFSPSTQTITAAGNIWAVGI